MFKFKEIKEVKDNFETKSTVKKEEEFKKIKSESGTTVEEAKAFWDSVFGF